eukprot:GHVN01010812.1.p1 GENE.GHVN01010812.1~~GHVN01010812.1.p1  ORF type:complete len:201 (+),score=29.87 GHVN01010812.1:499-1101(+)
MMVMMSRLKDDRKFLAEEDLAKCPLPMLQDVSSIVTRLLPHLTTSTGDGATELARRGVLLDDPPSNAARLLLAGRLSMAELNLRTKPEAYWVVDPIDGTKGYIRGHQYCTALALVEKGRTGLSVLSCPNLPMKRYRHDTPVPGGSMYFAIKGEGAYAFALPPSPSEYHIDKLWSSQVSKIHTSPQCIEENEHGSHGCAGG